MHNTDIERLTERERHVLTALRKKRDIRGAARLAEQACGRSLSTAGDLAELQGYATTAIRLAAAGHVAISPEGDTARFSLTATGRSAAKAISRSHRSPWRTVAGAGVWTTLALGIAGCSWLYTKPDVQEQYAPAPARPVQVAQYAETGKTVWRYCDVDCPRPTPKTIAIERPVMPVTAPVPPTPPTQPAPPRSIESSSRLISPPMLKMDPDFASYRGLVRFSNGSATLGPLGRAEVDAMIPLALKANTVALRGRTGTIRPSVEMLKLAVGRGVAVRKVFVEHGVTPDKIRIYALNGGFGALRNSINPRALENSRVEVEMTMPDGTMLKPAPTNKQPGT